MNSLHSDFYEIKRVLFDKYNFEISALKAEEESKEYGACGFNLNGKKIKFRVSKITPTKAGLFVTIWKRNASGITMPFESSDDIDFFIISARVGENFGQFIFPKKILIEKGIVTINGKEGKRGIRVYPPWFKDLNKQAERTQRWQSEYFMEIGSDNFLNMELVNKYLHVK